MRRILYGLKTSTTSHFPPAFKFDCHEHSIALGWRLAFCLDTSIGTRRPCIHNAQNEDMSAKFCARHDCTCTSKTMILPALLQGTSRNSLQPSLLFSPLPFLEYPRTVINHPHILNNILQTLYKCQMCRIFLQVIPSILFVREVRDECM